jgi:hypothetical protein
MKLYEIIKIFITMNKSMQPCEDCKTTKDAVKNGHLKCLESLHKLRSPWNTWTCAWAAYYGHLDCLQYAHDNKCPWDEKTCYYAAENGHLACLEYAHDNGCPWDENTCKLAAENGHLACLEYAHDNGCPWDERTFVAASNGQLECIRYAYENGCPWDSRVCMWASRFGHLDCLKYVHENKCPCKHLIKPKKHDVSLDVPAPSDKNNNDVCVICYVNLLKVQYKPCNHKFCITCTNILIDNSVADGNKKFTCAMCRTDVAETVLLDN